MNEPDIPSFVVEGGEELPVAVLVYVESQRVSDVLHILGLSPKLADVAELWRLEPSWFKDSPLFELVLAGDPYGEGKCWYVVPAGTHSLAVNLYSLLGRSNMKHEGRELGSYTIGPSVFNGVGDCIGLEAWKSSRVEVEVVQKKKEAPAKLVWPSEVVAVKTTRVKCNPRVPVKFDDVARGLDGLVTPRADVWDLVRYDCEEYVRGELQRYGDVEEPTFGDLIDLGEIWVDLDALSGYELMESAENYYVIPSRVDSWEAVPVWSVDGGGYARCDEGPAAIDWRDLIASGYESKVAVGLSPRPTWRELSCLPADSFVSGFEMWALGVYWRNGWWYRARRRGRLQTPVTGKRCKRMSGWRNVLNVDKRGAEALNPSTVFPVVYSGVDMQRAQACAAVLKDYGLYMSAEELMKKGLEQAFGIVTKGEFTRTTVVRKVVQALEDMASREMPRQAAVGAVKRCLERGDLAACIARKFGTVSKVLLPANELACCFLLNIFLEGGDDWGGMIQLLDDVGFRRRLVRKRD